MLNLEGAIKSEDLRGALRNHAKATLMGEALGFLAYKKAQRLLHEARSQLDTAKQGGVEQQRISDLQELIKELESVPSPDTPALREMMRDIYPFDKSYEQARLKDRYRR